MDISPVRLSFGKRLGRNVMPTMLCLGMTTAVWLLITHGLLADTTGYERDIKPLLKARCYACHGALKQEAGLRLDTGDAMRRGGDSGAAVIPGQANESRLLERVSASDAAERMPPTGEPLSPTQIELVKNWIRDGAKSPELEQAETDPRQHWAFQPPQRPDVPALDDRSGQGDIGNRVNVSSDTNPIDAFVNAELKRHGLSPRPAAPKQVLLRRVYLDLIGLPPTREELVSFLADESPDAYEKVVDRLLGDQRFGERWGRHWMDVWRYSDWYGRRDANDVRNSASQMYRWRNWIVQSLNKGQGYDRMLQSMLAADELFPEDYEAGVATGYLIRNYYSLNPNDWMRNTVEHTGKAFLGLTFNCAHCHDHKYDPIEHEDYFRMRAFFEPIFIRQDRLPGESDPGPFQDYTYAGSRSVQRLGAVRVYDKQLDAQTWFYTGGDERNRVKERGSIPPGVPAILQPETLKIEPVALPPAAWYPGLRPEIQETLLADAQRVVTTAEEALASVPVPEAITQFTSGATHKATDPTSSKEVVEAAHEISNSDELAQAEVAYAQALEQARSVGRPGALVGEQSLLLDATKGRTILQNGLASLSALDDGLTISFELLILQDAHVNFQLVKDSQQGLTADFVGWEKGRILAYKTGAADAVEVGKYDVAAGQTRFQVSFTLQPKMDEAHLTVRSMTDGVLLVENVSTKMNGWTPIGNDLQTISFDARPGSVAVIDSVHISPPSAESQSSKPLLAFDFEPPEYHDGASPLGMDGWQGSKISESGGILIVSKAASNQELREAAERLRLVRRKASAPALRRQAAEARVKAANAELSSLAARIAAERARYIEQSPVNELANLMRTASVAERQARLLRAESDVLSHDVTLLDAEAKPADSVKPADSAKRTKEIEAANGGLATARAAVEKARAALADEKLAETYAPLSAQFLRESTGRRRALAQWITRRDHPLTARVAVNHLWARHFRSPLVASVYDFGRNGARPTHPELLDWLAVEFMEKGWDMKHLQRLIVTSAAYRRVSSVGEADQSVVIDPENRWLWRMNSWRMESEVVRDSLLYVAGRLELTQGGVELENKEALTTNRRTLYYSSYPEAGGKSALGELFDAPDPLDCYRRASSIVPQQALALTNSDLVHQSSVAIVKAWQESTGSVATIGSVTTSDAAADTNVDVTDRFISELFDQVLSRSPSEAERIICRETMLRQQQLATDPQSPAAITQARESLARILLNHNDFVTVR